MKTLSFRHTFVTFLSLCALSFAGSAKAEKEFLAGFNQGWIFNRYGSQWVAGFDEYEFRRNIKLTKEAGGGILRYWLFEGFQPDSIVWKDGNAEKLNPKFEENLRKVLRAAKAEGMQLNLTMFDGNIGSQKPWSEEAKNFWWNLLNDKYSVRKDFIKNIYQPLLKILAEPEFKGVVTQLDLANEINAMTYKSHETRFEDAWHGANRMTCEFYEAKKKVKGAENIAYTASVGWGKSGEHILMNNPWPDCVDFYDFHVYDNGGDIPLCEELVTFARKKGKKIYLGEFGQDLGISWDWLQSATTRNFIKNAKACGLDGAYAWRLAEPESNAYLTFEKDGKLRPAYYEFRKALGLPEQSVDSQNSAVNQEKKMKAAGSTATETLDKKDEQKKAN